MLISLIYSFFIERLEMMLYKFLYHFDVNYDYSGSSHEQTPTGREKDVRNWHWLQYRNVKIQRLYGS